MKHKHTKRALLSSVLALVLCFSMMLGTTFAWFTDSVESTNNIITAGNLDVELEYAKVVDGAIKDWASVKEGVKVFDQDALWEPGRVEVVYLKVSNLGTLALKYQLGVNIANEKPGISVKTNEEFKLSEYLVFKVVEMPDALTTYTDREAVEAAAGTEKGLKDYNGKTTKLDAKGGTNAEDYVALIVYMPETVENEANYKTGTEAPFINLGVKLYATQVEAEEDSFGKDYDKDAWVDGMKVYSADDLVAAIEAGEDVVLMNDIAATEVIELTGESKIDLNGNTLAATIIAPNANLTIENGKIEATNPDASAIEINAGKLTLNDVEISSARHAVRVDGNVEVVINDGTYKVVPTTSKTLHALNVSGGAKVTVNGGTFIGPKGTMADSGAAVNVQAGSTVTINGGNFSGGKNHTLAAAGTLTVKGGTFDQDPSAYVAAGYKALASDGKYVVVAEGIDAVASTPAELTTQLTEAATAGSGDSTIVLGGDVDMTGTTWTPISVDGYHGAGVITIEGNGATIKGLTAPLFAGGFAGKSGIVIKNLTIADSDIVSTSGLGGGAFVDTADSMHVITLENCHLVNSTVTGERAGGLIGWCSGYAKLNDGPVKAYVTISNCSVVDSTVIGAGSAGAIAGHPGASDYTYTTIENCEVKNVDVISNDDGSWRTGAIVGTANNGHIVINNVKVEDVTLTQNGVAATETKLYGRFVPAGTGTLVIDGVSVLANATSEGLKDAIASGNANVYLPAGEYTLPSASNSDVTISGDETTVITIDKPAFHGSDVTLNGVTVKGSGYATGVQHVNTVTYNDATIEGEMCLYGEKVVFNDCTFELNGQYIWTYGAKVVEFNNCTFNTTGKAILIYNEGAGASNVTVKNCTFNATAGAKAGAIANQNCAAIEIDNFQSSGTGAAHILITEGNTYSNNFSGEWRIKNFVAGNSVTVNGTAYTSIAIDGKTMTIDGSKNVTVQ